MRIFSKHCKNIFWLRGCYKQKTDINLSTPIVLKGHLEESNVKQNIPEQRAGHSPCSHMNLTRKGSGNFSKIL